jgi:hypothetical protein
MFGCHASLVGVWVDCAPSEHGLGAQLGFHLFFSNAPVIFPANRAGRAELRLTHAAGQAALRKVRGVDLDRFGTQR